MDQIVPEPVENRVRNTPHSLLDQRCADPRLVAWCLAYRVDSPRHLVRSRSGEYPVVFSLGEWDLHPDAVALQQASRSIRDMRYPAHIMLDTFRLLRTQVRC